MFIALAIAFAGEKNIAVSALPAPIVAAINANYAGATITEASTEVEKGVTEYEAEIKLGERSMDLAFTADGTLLEEEERMTLAALPAPVQATIAGQSGWTMRRAERATAAGVTTYEVQLEQGKKRIELFMDAAGVVKSKERIGHSED